VLESGADLLTPIDFGFGKCRLCLAAPRGRSVTAELGRSLRVATKFPRLTTQWFLRRGVPVDLVHLAGSVELAAVSGLTDAIVDLVESGRTLEENGLAVVDELLQVSARLVVNRAAYRLKVEELLRCWRSWDDPHPRSGEPRRARPGALPARRESILAADRVGRWPPSSPTCGSAGTSRSAS